MAEMVGSAVAQEAAHQLLSRFMERYGQRSSDAKERMERMEMAHIRLEAALEASHRWGIVVTSAPLLRWRSKLKRAAEECDHALRRCRRRLRQQEEEEARQPSSLPGRVARAARSFVSSILGGGGGGDDELGGRSAAVRRFERFADGASEFLSYVELGGTPRRRLFGPPLDGGLLVRHLLAGRGTKYCSVHGGQHLSLVLQPFSPPPGHGRRMEGALLFLLEDGVAPENNFLLSLRLRLSESTDIVGVVVRCLELFAPHLSSTADAVKTKLTQIPTQDLRWVPDAYSVFGRDEHRDNLHSTTSEWFRPNPLCCQEQDHHHGSKLFSKESFPSDDVYLLEPVIQVYLLGHVTLPAGRRAAAVAVDGEEEARGSPYLKLGGHLWPHAASSDDLRPAVGGSATETTIIGEATQHDRLDYANISFEELGEIVLPQAVHRLGEDVAATSYQVMWRSKHGRAYLHAEKASWRPNDTRAADMAGMSSWRGRRRKKKVMGWTRRSNEFVSSWIAYAPAQLQASAVDWIRKQERLPLPLFLKATPCTHDCPIAPLPLQDLRSLARRIKSFSTFNAAPLKA